MTRAFRPWAYLALTRPANLIIVVISVAVGAAVSGPSSSRAIWAAVAAGILIAAGGNAMNDSFDREIDRVNKPGRPIPSGAVTNRRALVFSIVCLVMGWSMASAVGFAALALVSVWLVLLFLYSPWLKRTGLPGNLVVSAVSASAFLLGGLAADVPERSLIPAGLAFLFHLGREIIKDAQDLAGDERVGVRSLAARYGKDRALSCAAAVFVLLIAATPLPFLAGTYNGIYLVAVIVGVDLPLLYVTRAILAKPTEKRLGKLSALLKADMIVGIACVLAGSGAVF